MRRCEATTLASTYSEAHQCLKRHGVKRSGKRYLCAHHQNTPPAVRAALLK